MSIGLLKGRSLPGSIVSQPGEDLVSVQHNIAVFSMPNAKGEKKKNLRRVVLSQSMGGTFPNRNTTFEKHPGDVVEMLAEEAARFVERGYAVYLPEQTV